MVTLGILVPSFQVRVLAGLFEKRGKTRVKIQCFFVLELQVFYHILKYTQQVTNAKPSDGVMDEFVKLEYPENS